MEINCTELSNSKMLGYEDYIKSNDIDHKLTCAIIQVGERKDSTKYVNNKVRKLNKVGINTEVINIKDDNYTISELSFNIAKLNSDKNIHSILVQLPLPKWVNEDKIIEMIDPSKDIDCITRDMESRTYRGDHKILPCTVQSVYDILDYINVDVVGKNVLVIGRSRIVGKPLAVSLINKGATVTVANSKTKDIDNVIANNEIIVSACGVNGILNSDNLNSRHIVIDVGINFDENGKICGDMDRSASYIPRAYTPVPKGVGILTTTNVVGNIIKLYNK